MKRLALLLAVLLCRPAFAGPQDAINAVARIPSHGCSATCIYTEPGRSYFLGCAHAYEGADARKPMVFDCPAPLPGAKQPVRSYLIAVDHDRDLSLVELHAGPLPFVAPVAPLGRVGRLESCGYDEMILRPAGPLHKEATLLAPVRGILEDQNFTHTRERPWHGRSGGGLIDIDRGLLVGTCTGYETTGQRRGIYTSLPSIHAFLAQHAPGQAAVAQGQPASADVFIPLECRVLNRSGAQCVWASLETLARLHRIQRLYGLTATYTELASPVEVDQVLGNAGARYTQQRPGNRDQRLLRYAVENGLACMIGLEGKHACVLIGLDSTAARVISNNRPTRETQSIPRQEFERLWDGWVCVLWPDQDPARDPAPRPPAQRIMLPPACPPGRA